MQFDNPLGVKGAIFIFPSLNGSVFLRFIRPPEFQFFIAQGVLLHEIANFPMIFRFSENFENIFRRPWPSCPPCFVLCLHITNTRKQRRQVEEGGGGPWSAEEGEEDKFSGRRKWKDKD